MNEEQLKEIDEALDKQIGQTVMLSGKTLRMLAEQVKSKPKELPTIHDLYTVAAMLMLGTGDERVRDKDELLKMARRIADHAMDVRDED